MPLAFLACSAVLVVIAFQIQSPLPVVGGLAAIIALGSLVTSAWTAYTGWIRIRKKDTLEAWETWSDGSKDDRAALTKVLGQNVGLNDEQAAAICDGLSIGIGSTTIDEETSADLRRRIIKVLGGLERLAVGIEQQIFDLDLLMEIGGTIVIGTFERFRPYVDYLHNHPDPDRRKSQAYICLSALVVEIQSEQAREKRKYFDTARVDRIKRATGKGKSI